MWLGDDGTEWMKRREWTLSSASSQAKTDHLNHKFEYTVIQGDTETSTTMPTFHPSFADHTIHLMFHIRTRLASTTLGQLCALILSAPIQLETLA